MKWSTGITVLFFLALVIVIRNPDIIDEVGRVIGPEEEVLVPSQPAVDPTPSGNISSNGTPAPPQSTATPRSVPKSELTIHDLKLLALSYINKDRADHSLPPVTLGENPAAQSHADDMLAGRYLGHWWRDGSKPYMVYSQTGGTSYVSENAARTGFSFAEYEEHCNRPAVRCQKVDPVEDMKRLEYAMMYDDAESNWGHRDNILNPSHRKVNIGIAYSDHFLAFVQHFEGGAVTATQMPVIEDSVLTLQASINEPDVQIFDVMAIYREEPPEPRTAEEIEQLHSYCVGGGFTAECGQVSIRVIPPPSPGRHYVDLPPGTVVADTWEVTAQSISITAYLGARVSRPGVYTLTLYADNGGSSSGHTVLQLSIVEG